jgi:transcriptional regulator with XRE-family HTH domain
MRVKTQKTEVQLNFGDSIRKYRNEKKLSQEQLASLSDLDRTYIGGIERGERNPSLVNIHKIAVALGIKIKDLFND